MSIKLDDVISVLRSIIEPNIGRDVLSLGMVRDLKIEDSKISFRFVQKNPNNPEEKALVQTVKNALVKLGATEVNIQVESTQEAAQRKAKSNQAGVDKHGIPNVKNIIAVSSGKGGVGKSTVSANLAVSLARLGFKIGLLDCDIYGPNIPTMMGVEEPPHAIQDEKRGEMILPLENHGVKVMSMGLLTKGDQPVIWRGPMLHSVVAQFLLKVEWGELDYLVVDMPPGTGDVQLSLTQLVPVTGAVVVTTPQEVAAQDVRRAILMFDKVNVPIIGIVENMSFFVPEDEPQKKYYIFGKGGAGRVLSEKFKVPLLAELPIDPNVCEAGDTGTPIAAKENKLANVYLDLAKTVVQRINQIKTLGTYENIEIGSW